MKGATIWFTGLPCSGKTTVADKVYNILKERGYKVERLDGDIIRKSPISKDLGFSKEDRRKNLERVAFIAKLLSRNDVIVLATFVSPYNEIRRDIKEIIGPDRFHLVWTRCPVEVCIERDVKGMYKKALAGEIQNFTGIDDPFEEPTDPAADLILDTDKEDIDESVEKVLAYMKRRGLIE
ncbi:adenylyl-sulfate kinase [Candidatus Aciduliprofundum boonei]|uniref:Adenylyl-sulfate kinase n=1 Tax=Aciduliprofundum boonei (strain DSM 19572 / T469) TaxID=439481 RepID=B5IDW1_ACIB4|nr:adenylyl-sulfate kinase [Candidatus Aciduliprofundum boonei]ADD08046.1 adenylylsulfate kinase [Aciduliprofundum boonei T469]EDY35495.1 adenylylsulfate kinase [Aciduliprofundum boonei T469]